MQREASPSFNVAPIGTAFIQGVVMANKQWVDTHVPVASDFTATKLTQQVLVARTCTDTSHPCTANQYRGNTDTRLQRARESVRGV